MKWLIKEKGSIRPQGGCRENVKEAQFAQQDSMSPENK